MSSSPHSTVLVGTDGSDSSFPAVESHAVDALLQLDSLAGRVPGSVSANISHRARCDVLIVHTTGRGAKQQG